MLKWVARNTVVDAAGQTSVKKVVSLKQCTQEQYASFYPASSMQAAKIDNLISQDAFMCLDSSEQEIGDLQLDTAAGTQS